MAWHRIVPLVLLVTTSLGGCVAPELTPSSLDGTADLALTDDPARVPNATWYDQEEPSWAEEHDGRWHSWEQIAERILGFEERRPDLVDVRVVGESIQGRPIYDVVVTNESAPGPKVTPLIDGGHHAAEIEGIELSLYIVDFLLENHDTNASVRAMLEDVELHIVPLVNPDGYAIGPQRGNALGVNLNRNYDVDWGNPAGASNPVMGTLAHETGEPMPSISVVAENCGDEPFSEPETQAVRDLLEELDPTLAFYLSFHTPTHALIAPWAAADAPYEMPARDRAVHETVLQWTRDHTEYEAGKAQWGNVSAGLPYSASGSSMDWAYLRHTVPSFTLEVGFYATSVTSDDYVDRAYLDDYEGLRYWMDASLPIPLYLLANAEQLAGWQDPAEDPPIPPGVPPAPPS